MIDVLIIGGCIHLNHNLTDVDNLYRYRWVNVVLEDPHGPPPLANNLTLNTPYIDPPIGGWLYDPIDINTDDKYYWDNNPSSKHSVYNFVTAKNNVEFIDCPIDTRLTKGQEVKFITVLVDTKENKLLYQVDWRLYSHYNLSYSYKGEPRVPLQIYNLITK